MDQAASSAAASTGRLGSPAAVSASSIRTLNPSREVFGFATSGSLADPSFGYPTWNFDLLSTVAFYAIHVQYDGVLIADSNWSVWDSSVLTGLVTTAHAHGAKVVITLRGPSDPTDFCDSLYNADTTTLQIVNQVVAKGVDGVNIDYEGQLRLCQNNNPALNETNQALLTNFAKLMRAGLDKARPGYYLSIDTYSASASATDGFFNIPDLTKYVDSFFVMAYDMDVANWGLPPLNCTCLGPVSPLTNYTYNDTTSMAQYSAVAGPSKTILGQPYYGRVACVANPVANAPPTTSVLAVTYLDAIDVLSSPDVKPGTYGVHRGDAIDTTGLDRWDTWYDQRLGCWREMYWADATQLGSRYDLVNQDNLRGVGFWTLNYGGGSAELWSTLQSRFVSCGSASVSAAPPSPSLSGTQVHLTATSTNCNNPLYEFWILPPGGTWTLAQGYTSSPNLYWNTMGKSLGSYRFSVWAIAANTRGLSGTPSYSYDAFTNLDYALTTSPCNAMAVTSSPVSTAPIDTQVTFAGSASGCPNPSYEFWIQPPGGTWAVAQNYSTSPAFNWNTTGRALGSYRFSVWARDQSSPGTGGTAPYTYDSFSGFQYTLTPGPCTAMSATSAPPSTANVGMTVTITGSATGCPIPFYEFWLLPSGGIWTLVQPYSANPTFSWNTTGDPVGAYRFSVWARGASSPGTSGTPPYTYDAFSAVPITLTISPCTAMSASSSPVSTANAGTMVAVSGSASGCSNPRYEFWLLPPGGTWALAQAYSSSSTFNWDTRSQPAGSYRFSVWTRDASSPGSSGTAPYTYDAFSAIQYTLTTAPCTGMSASSSPPSTAAAGMPVTITGSATGCPNPLYQFWLLPPGGTWTVAQPYSISATFNWSTAGKPTGSYRFSVWARDASSPGTSGGAPYTYDAFSALQYALT